MSFEPTLILFDVDGTLIDCGPQVRPLVGRALEAVYGVRVEIGRCDFAGKTDDGIVAELLGAAGVGRPAIEDGLEAMREHYAALLDRELDAAAMRRTPGVGETLDRLRRRPGVEIGLLTGNWRRGAEIKLSRLGLEGYFAFGAFGDGVVDRTELPPRALASARRTTGRSFTAAETLIVGDTARDVACAHAHGIRALGVATGRASQDDLRLAGADWVAPDLPSAAILRDRVAV